MLHIGTCGYNYPEWRGSFYPDTLPASRMRAYYFKHEERGTGPACAAMLGGFLAGHE